MVECTAEELAEKFYQWLNMHNLDANLIVSADSKERVVVNFKRARYHFSFSDLGTGKILHMHTASTLKLEDSFGEIVNERVRGVVANMNRERRNAYYSYFGEDFNCYITPTREPSKAVNINADVSFFNPDSGNLSIERDAFPFLMDPHIVTINAALLKASKVI